MIVVAGHLTVAADRRETYLAACVDVVEQARRTPGCFDFALSADSLDPSRINILERWDSVDAVEAFRTGGPEFEPPTPILTASVEEYDVADSRALFSKEDSL